MRLGSLGALMALAGCAGPLSTLDPAGPAAGTIATIWWVMLAGATVLMALVLGLFAYAFRGSDAAWAQAGHTRFILWGGLVMPMTVLTALMIYALIAGERLLAHPAPDVWRVEARGERWQWRFSYPARPELAETIDLATIPAGRPVDVEIVSQDVIHSFWVPRLAGKLDAIPGHRNTLRIEADRPGRFSGVCAEYCGIGHAGMTFTIEALAPDDFAAFAGEAAR